MMGGQMELTERLADPLDRVNKPLDDRLAIEARTDAEAFAPLYERHLQRVYRYLRARGANEDDAAELAALTFERALTHIDRYQPGGPGFAPWLLRIARNAFVDSVRRQSHGELDLNAAAGLMAPGQSPEEAVIAAEESRWIASLVARLPEAQRDALALRFAGGLTSREIAQVIGKSEAATKKLLTRSIVTLKEASRNDS
jgi:RNA polymerase sigma-70 factor (ECF subfamily)